MRGTTAKRIRRSVYGDKSLRDKKQTTMFSQVVKIFKRGKNKGKPYSYKTGQIVNLGLRVTYQQEKRLWKQLTRKERRLIACQG